MAAEKVSEESAIREKNAKNARFKLGSHYTMERFCATFIVFTAALVLIVISAFHQRYENGKITLTSQAIYTPQSYFSLTGEMIYVKGLWTNESKTRGFILLQASDGMGNLSTQASDYQMFMTGRDTKLTNNPTGTIYVFGNTGYIGLGFTDSAGFQPAAYDIVVRNTSYLSEGNESLAEQRYGDDVSSQHFNQCRIIANFAASEAEVAKFYSKPGYTAYDIYHELVQTEEVQAQVEQCNVLIDTINSSMRRANEYARRLETQDQVSIVDDVPASIFGDAITTQRNADEPVYFDREIMPYLNSGSLVEEDQGFAFVDDHARDADPDAVFYLSTDYVFPGGVNYDYNAITSETDLLAEVVPEGVTYQEFRAGLDEDASEFSNSSEIRGGEYIDIRTGAVITDTSEEDVLIKGARDDIEAYEEALKSIYDSKKTLQTDYLRNILDIYYYAVSVNDITSVYSNKDTLLMY